MRFSGSSILAPFVPSAANPPFFSKFLIAIAIAFGIAIDRFPIPAFSAPLRPLSISRRWATSETLVLRRLTVPVDPLLQRAKIPSPLGRDAGEIFGLIHSCCPSVPSLKWPGIDLSVHLPKNNHCHQKIEYFRAVRLRGPFRSPPERYRDVIRGDFCAISGRILSKNLLRHRIKSGIRIPLNVRPWGGAWPFRKP